MAKFQRKTYDAEAKERVVAAVRSRQKTVAEIAKEEGIQPYQVYAWVGEAALRDPPHNGHGSSNDMTGETTGTIPQLTLDEGAMTDAALQQAIGKWWLETHAVSQSKK